MCVISGGNVSNMSLTEIEKDEDDPKFSKVPKNNCGNLDPFHLYFFTVFYDVFKIRFQIFIIIAIQFLSNYN